MMMVKAFLVEFQKESFWVSQPELGIRNDDWMTRRAHTPAKPLSRIVEVENGFGGTWNSEW